jgi:hypothetical protein
MALLWVEGFEAFGAAGGEISPSTILAQKYNTNSSANTCNIVTGRDGINAALFMDTQGAAILSPQLIPNTIDTTITGFAYKSGNLTTNHPICTFRHFSATGAAIDYSALDLWQIGDELAVFRGTTTINTTSSNVLESDTWHYIEMKVKCADSGGTIEVKVDGTTVIDEPSVDSAYATGAVAYPTVGFRRLSAPNTEYYVDDWYICDNTGSTCNDFLGSCTVYTLFPNADASGNMTANSGSDEYAMVNSTTQNTAKYIKDTASGNRCVFEYGALSITPNTVYGVQVNTEAALSANLLKGVKALSQNASGTVNSHTSFPIANDPTAVTQVLETNADGDTWNGTLISSARFGIEVV